MSNVNLYSALTSKFLMRWSRSFIIPFIQAIKNGFIAILSLLSWSCETATSSSVIIPFTFSM